MLLDPGARRANSAWSFVPPDVSSASVETLRDDLDDATWDARHGYLRRQPTFDGSLLLITNRPRHTSAPSAAQTATGQI